MMKSENFNWLISKARTILITQKKRHITFVLQRNTIINVGLDFPYKTHPLAGRFHFRFSAIHSELDALKRIPVRLDELDKYIQDYTLVNVRIKANGSVGLSKPCLNCQKLLAFFGVKEVYFTNNEGNFERMSL